jgi:hypothetical protein
VAVRTTRSCKHCHFTAWQCQVFIKSPTSGGPLNKEPPGVPYVSDRIALGDQSILSVLQKQVSWSKCYYEWHCTERLRKPNKQLGTVELAKFHRLDEHCASANSRTDKDLINSLSGCHIRKHCRQFHCKNSKADWLAWLHLIKAYQIKILYAPNSLSFRAFTMVCLLGNSNGILCVDGSERQIWDIRATSVTDPPKCSHFLSVADLMCIQALAPYQSDKILIIASGKHCACSVRFLPFYFYLLRMSSLTSILTALFQDGPRREPPVRHALHCVLSLGSTPYLVSPGGQ